MEEFAQFTVEKHGTNPYYDKWKRGRPSNEARKRRVLYHAWNEKHYQLYPEMYPGLTHLLRSSDPVGTVVNTDGVRSVKIRYVQRSTGN